MTALRQYVAAAIHGLVVTEAAVGCDGPVIIDGDMLAAAGIEPRERLSIVNLANGERWETYALPVGEGDFKLTGGSARRAAPGDPCVVMAWVLADRPPAGRCIMVGGGLDAVIRDMPGCPPAG